jgi:hypothetical protein
MTYNKNNYISNLFDSDKHYLNKNYPGEFNIKIKTQYPDDSAILYWACNPPIYMSSFTGSGLPFSNPDIAFENTPNIGLSRVVNGIILINISFPNSFYTNFGNKIIEPTLFYRLFDDKNSKVISFNLKNRIPYRGEYFDKNKGVLNYYNNQNCGITNQENILRSYGYPKKNKISDNFWGNKKPN